MRVLEFVSVSYPGHWNLFRQGCAGHEISNRFRSFCSKFETSHRCVYYNDLCFVKIVFEMGLVKFSGVIRKNVGLK